MRSEADNDFGAIEGRAARLIETVGKCLSADHGISRPFEEPVPVLKTPKTAKHLQAIYGVAFSPCLIAVWELAKRLDPERPRRAFSAIGVTLVGPFDLLAGDLESKTVMTTPLVHWRFAMDPPELFTVMSGEVDGVHWGYFFDEPNRKSKWIVQTYANDAYDLRPVGLTLPGGLRWCIEARQADADEYGERPPSELEELRRRVVDLQLEVATPMQRELLRKDAGIRGRQYTGRSYRLARTGSQTAPTLDGMGLGTVRRSYAPMKGASPEELTAAIREPERLAELAREAKAFVARGKAGSALKLGRDLWALAGTDPALEPIIVEILDAGYEGMGFEAFRAVLRAHVLHRRRRSVSMFDSEP